MKNLRAGILILIILGLLAPLTASAQRKSNKKKPRKAKPVVMKDVPVQPPTTAADFKILAGGDMSAVEVPFIFVARDAKTYELLKKIAPDLPAATTINFQQNSVVAAFLGTKPTPGYGISIQKTANGATKIGAIEKPAGAITAQVLTAPYKIALVPADYEQELPLEVASDWTRKAETFRVSSGEFQFSGGFIATEKKFAVGGSINVWRAGDLITIDFGVTGKGADANLKMDEIASGQITGNNLILERVDPGSLIATPRPALKATGTFDGNKISLSFDPLRSIYSDGYSGTGKFEAVK